MSVAEIPPAEVSPDVLRVLDEARAAAVKRRADSVFVIVFGRLGAEGYYVDQVHGASPARTLLAGLLSRELHCVHTRAEAEEEG